MFFLFPFTWLGSIFTAALYDRSVLGNFVFILKLFGGFFFFSFNSLWPPTFSSWWFDHGSPTFWHSYNRVNLVLDNYFSFYHFPFSDITCQRMPPEHVLSCWRLSWSLICNVLGVFTLSLVGVCVEHLPKSWSGSYAEVHPACSRTSTGVSVSSIRLCLGVLVPDWMPKPLENDSQVISLAWKWRKTIYPWTLFIYLTFTTYQGLF